MLTLPAALVASASWSRPWARLVLYFYGPDRCRRAGRRGRPTRLALAEPLRGHAAGRGAVSRTTRLALEPLRRRPIGLRPPGHDLARSEPARDVGLRRPVLLLHRAAPAPCRSVHGPAEHPPATHLLPHRRGDRRAGAAPADSLCHPAGQLARGGGRDAVGGAAAEALGAQSLVRAQLCALLGHPGRPDVRHRGAVDLCPGRAGCPVLGAP